MITTIEETVLKKVTDRIEGLKVGGIQKDSKQLLMSTAVAVAVLEGQFERITDYNWKQEVTVSILVKFKNVASEEARRKGINPIVQGIVQLLLMQTLNLKIKPLKPGRFRDVTTEEKYEQGVIEYLIEFTTSFTISVLEEEEVTDLLTAGFTYLLKPGDELADASDTIALGGAQQ